MKSKNYWDRTAAEGDPFQVAKKVAKGLAAFAHKYENHAKAPARVKYLWIYVTENALRRKHGGILDIDGWLNTIDEAASLGAEWMVVYVGATLCECPEIWKMSAWAQKQHAMRVGLHLSNACLSEDDIERLTTLDLSRTYLIADEDTCHGLRTLRDKGVQVCDASVATTERMTPCSNPEAIVCVGIDGRLFTCGLVLGNDAYHLGNVLERGLREVIEDSSLPHVIPNTVEYPEHGCDGCPSHVALRVSPSLPA